MDFITDNGHTILYADISYFFPILLRSTLFPPDCEDCTGKTVLHFPPRFSFQILKIDVITVVFSLIKVAAHYFSAIVLNNL